MVGLCPVVDNFRIQDTLVELIGIRVPPLLATGVIHRMVLPTVSKRVCFTATRPARGGVSRSVSVPSGVLLLEFCILILVFCFTLFLKNIMVE